MWLKGLVFTVALQAIVLTYATDIRIELLESASVNTLYYTLGDVAVIQAPGEATVKQLSAHRLGRTPRIGHSRGVSRAEVTARVTRLSPQLRERISWQGPLHTRVQGAGQQLLPRDYLSDAQASLNDWLAQRFNNYHVEPVPTRTAVKLPLGKIEIRPRLYNLASVSRRMNVWLDFYVDDEHYRSVTVWFDVTAYASGLVAATDLSAGTVLKNESVHTQMLEVTAACLEPAWDALPVKPQRLRRDVKIGQPLCREYLSALPSVARGDAITVSARSGPVLVQAIATALEDGEAGETIDVRRGQRGPRFAVLVTGVKQAIATGEDHE